MKFLTNAVTSGDAYSQASGSVRLGEVKTLSVPVTLFVDQVHWNWKRVYVTQLRTVANHGLEGVQSSHSIPITPFDIDIRR